MIPTRILLVLFGLALAGCGPRWAPYNAQGVPAQQAYAECDYQSKLATSGQNFSDSVANRIDLIRSCMALKGF